MLSNCGVGEDSWESMDTKEIKPSVLNEINPEYSLEGLMLKLKLQYFGHLLWRTDSLEKTLMLGKIEGRRRRGRQRMRWLDGIADLMAMSLSKLQEIVRTGKPSMLQSMGSQRVKYDSVTEQAWIYLTYWRNLIQRYRRMQSSFLIPLESVMFYELNDSSHISILFHPSFQ